MIALDTNVLVRVLVDDPDAARQCTAARRLVAAADTLWLPLIVTAETLWVLHRSYKLPKPAIAAALGELLAHPRYRLESEALLRAALAHFIASPIEFGDALALASSEAAGALLHSFDRKLGKLPGAQALAA